MRKLGKETQRILIKNMIGSVFVTLIALSFIMIFSGQQAWSAQEDPVLTVERALDLASENNPVISATMQQVRQSEERLNQAKAPLYPSLDANLGYQKTGEEPRLPVYDVRNRPAPYYVQEGFRETYRAALGLTWLIYSGGTVKYNVQAKELALDSVNASATRTFQSVDNNVKTAFYSLQRARAKLIVAKEALRLAREHLREVELFYKHGVVAQNQVLRVQVEVSDSELNRITAANGVDVGWSALERAVGLPLREHYSLPEVRSDVKSFEIPADFQILALKKRPELKALEKSRLSALALSKSAAGQGKPQVFIEAGTYVADNEFFPDMEDDWNISIGATWNFYDGGESKAKAKEAKAAADELLYRIEDLKKQISLEVSTALLNLRSSTQRVAVAQDQVKSAEEEYRMALRRYKAQVGTNIDVLDSRVALVNARTQLAEAVYDTHQSRADLLFALGIESFSELD